MLIMRGKLVFETLNLVKIFIREGQKNRVSANIAIKLIFEFREEHKLGNKEEIRNETLQF